MEMPKDELENKRMRLKIIIKCEQDPEFKEMIRLKCSKDIIFFCDLFTFTFNPRLDNASIPFILYPFQEKYIKGLLECVEIGKDSFTEKSRDMGVSWMLVAFSLWHFLFKKTSSLYGSYKEDYVDSMGNMDSFFERLRFMIKYLPKWLLPSDMVDKYMNISSKKLEAEIAGDTGQNFGRGGRRSFVILDEFSYWQYDQSAWRGTRDVTNCRIFAGTPNGAYNIYGKVMTSHKDYAHLNLRKFRLHWSEHPLKTKEWYENEKNRRTREDIARELDISYDDSVEGAVYKNFMQDSKFVKVLDYNLTLGDVYTAWDFGRDTTAIIWFQKDLKTNTIYIFDTYQNQDKEIDFYMAFLTGKPVQGYKYTEDEIKKMDEHFKFRTRYSRHYGDPYNGKSKTVVSDNSIADIFQSYGYYLDMKRGTTVEDRIDKTKLAMRRMVIKEDLYEFIQAIIQSRYPSQKENSQNTRESTLPVHDSNSHFRTCLEYLCDNEEDILPVFFRGSNDDFYEDEYEASRLFNRI